MRRERDAARAIESKPFDFAQAAKPEAAADALERIDGEFHREQADQLRNLARELRGVPQNG